MEKHVNLAWYTNKLDESQDFELKSKLQDEVLDLLKRGFWSTEVLKHPSYVQ